MAAWSANNQNERANTTPANTPNTAAAAIGSRPENGCNAARKTIRSIEPLLQIPQSLQLLDQLFLRPGVFQPRQLFLQHVQHEFPRRRIARCSSHALDPGPKILLEFDGWLKHIG